VQKLSVRHVSNSLSTQRRQTIDPAPHRGRCGLTTAYDRPAIPSLALRALSMKAAVSARGSRTQNTTARPRCPSRATVRMGARESGRCECEPVRARRLWARAEYSAQIEEAWIAQ
jgi:hypothetical protein